MQQMINAKTISHEPSRSPYLVPLTNLRGNPGKTMELPEFRVPMQAEWTNNVVKLLPEETGFRVSLQALSDGILVHVTGSVETEAQCSRCLDPVSGLITVDETQMFFLPGTRQSAKAEGDPQWEDIAEISSQDEIDLEPVLRDALVLAMENLPLCNPDCLGLCPTCGQRRDELEADHSHEATDPRWSVLEGLADNLRENDGNDESI